MLPLPSPPYSLLFFFNAPAPSEIYTLSLHDALPIPAARIVPTPGTTRLATALPRPSPALAPTTPPTNAPRSEEHTSELQSRPHLVCRLLLEKKKKKPDQDKTPHHRPTHIYQHYFDPR